MLALVDLIFYLWEEKTKFYAKHDPTCRFYFQPIASCGWANKEFAEWKQKFEWAAWCFETRVGTKKQYDTRSANEIGVCENSQID